MTKGQVKNIQLKPMTELYTDNGIFANTHTDNNSNSFQIDNNNNNLNCQQVIKLLFEGKSKEISINCDTEYVDIYIQYKGFFQKKTITCQFKEHNQKTARLYTHSDMKTEKIPFKIVDKELSKIIDLYPMDNDDIPVFKYLGDISQAKIELTNFKRQYIKKKKTKETEGEQYPTLTINICGHFLIVDFIAVLGQEISDFIVKCFLEGKLNYSKNLQSNYTSTYKTDNGDIGHSRKDYIPFNKQVKIRQGDNEYLYNLNIKFNDTFGRLGPVSYKNYATAIGYDLPSKDLIDNSDKSDMLKYFNENPENFIKYSLGDCESSLMIEQTDKLYKQICNNLKIDEIKTRPTIGGTVNKLITNFLLKETEYKIDLEKYLTYNANSLKKFDGTTKLLLSLIFGGRCFSNNHIARIINSIIIDIDFEGAYNSVLNAVGFNFYLGNPDIYTIPIENPKDIRNRKTFDFSKGITLREYLSENQSKFAPFGCQIVVCSKSNNMKICQDLLVSKYNVQITFDKEIENYYLKEKSGITKVFANDIFNAVIPYSTLFRILNDSDKNTVSYLLDNLIVVAAAFYNKEKQCHDLSKLNDDNWYAIPIYKLTSYIRALRECYPKDHPLNDIYKRTANTCYGVSASCFFAISNPLTANNITGLVRDACYELEKTFNGIKSITDGCQVDINNIITNRHNQNSLNINNMVRLNNLTNTELNRKNLKKTSLTNSKWSIEYHCKYDDKGRDIGDYELKNLKKGVSYNKKRINKLLLKLLMLGKKNLPMFSTHIIKSENSNSGSPDNFLCEVNGKKFYYNQIKKKNIISIEIKSVNTDLVGHGSANHLLNDVNPNVNGHVENGIVKNYCLLNDVNQTIKYRSFMTSGYHEIFSDLSYIPCDSPAKIFLNQLLENPTKVKRSKVFMKKQILKPNQYIAIPEKWKKLNYKIGDSIPVVGVLTEFSISNFLFNNFDDYMIVLNEYQSLKNKYGQSFEMWFINHDGTLNYELMNDTISKLIPILNGKKLSFYLNKLKKLSESEKYHPCHLEKMSIKEKMYLPWIEYQECQKSKKYSQDYTWDDLFDDLTIDDSPQVDPDNPDLMANNDNVWDDIF